jgi:thymidylate synthase
MLKPIFIEARDLPDAWFQALYKCVEIGKDFIIDRGSYEGQKRLEFDYITLHIKHPENIPLLPEIPVQYNIPNPVHEDYIEEYLPYLMTSSKKDTEAYTYGERLTNEHITSPLLDQEVGNEDIVKMDNEIWYNDNIVKGRYIGSQFLSQLELLIWTYKNKGYRNNQMCLQVAKPEDMLLCDPPCLRHIDTRIQNNLEKEKIKLIDLLTHYGISFDFSIATNEYLKDCFISACKDQGNLFDVEGQLKNCEVPELHFYPYFRSWDLWGGFPANLAAIELMKQYVALEIGVENGEMIASSKGLHIYNYVWKLAEIIRGKTIEEFKKEMGE